MKYAIDFGPSASGVPRFDVFRNVNTSENLLVSAPAFTFSPLQSGYTQFNWTSGIILQFRAMISGNSLDYIPGLIDQTDGLPGIGEGSVQVDHNYGGTDNLRVLDTDTSAPIDNAYIYAYLAEDYNAGRTERPTYVKGITITNVDGRWANSLWLDPADYILLIIATGHQAKIVSLTVT